MNVNRSVSRLLPIKDNKEKWLHTPMLRVGFESLIPALERQKTVYSLDLTATVIGLFDPVNHNPMDVYVVYRLCVSQT